MRKILQKTASVMGIQVVYQMAVFVNKALLTRILSVSDFGILSIILMWGNFVSQLIGFGTNKLVTKEIAANQNSGNNHVISNVTRWSFLVIISISAFLLSLILIELKYSISSFSLSAPHLVLLILIAFSLAIYDWHFSILNGLGNIVQGRFIQFIAIPISLFILLIFYYWQSLSSLDYIIRGYALIYLSGTLLAIGVSLRISKAFACSGNISRKTIKKWLSFSTVNFGTVFLQTLFLKLDLIFINIFFDAEEFALYSIASGILGILTFVNYAFVLSLESRISYFHSRGKIKKLIPFLRRNLIIQTLLILLIYGGVLIFGEMVLGIFGEEYKRMSSVLNILCLVLFAQALTGSSGVLLIMTGNLKERFLSTLIPALAATICYPFIIENSGLKGVAITYLIMMLIHRVLMTIYVNKKFGFKFFYMN